MSETENAVDVPNVADDPLLSGGLLIVGAVLAGFGDRSSVDVGRALTAVGAASFVALQMLLLVLG